jgi:DNA polymerase-3 subunit epsilon
MNKKKFYEKPFVFLDVETTGLDPDQHEVIQIAILREDTKEFWTTRIKPSHIETASLKALEINGYKDNPHLWDDAPCFDEVAFTIRKKLSNSIVVGHNIQFDLSFLKSQMLPLGQWVGIGHHHFDTVSLAIEHLSFSKISSVSLKNVCKLLGISTENHHDAKADVEMTQKVFRKLIRATCLHRMWWRIKRPFIFKKR